MTGSYPKFWCNEEKERGTNVILQENELNSKLRRGLVWFVHDFMVQQECALQSQRHLPWCCTVYAKRMVKARTRFPRLNQDWTCSLKRMPEGPDPTSWWHLKPDCLGNLCFSINGIELSSESQGPVPLYDIQHDWSVDHDHLIEHLVKHV